VFGFTVSPSGGIPDPVFTFRPEAGRPILHRGVGASCGTLRPGSAGGFVRSGAVRFGVAWPLSRSPARRGDALTWIRPGSWCPRLALSIPCPRVQPAGGRLLRARLLVTVVPGPRSPWSDPAALVVSSPSFSPVERGVACSP